MSGSDGPAVEFRLLEYGEALRNDLERMARQAAAELPGHPDLKPPEGPELEASERGAYVAAYVGGVPAASGGLRTFPDDPSGETAELVRLYVSPDSRRSGIGRALLGELEALAREEEYRYTLLHVGVEQRAAQALYEIIGYRRVPESPDRDGLRTYRKDLHLNHPPRGG